jgi:hypothetical protein
MREHESATSLAPPNNALQCALLEAARLLLGGHRDSLLQSNSMRG